VERGRLHLNINIVYSKVLQALSTILTNQLVITIRSKQDRLLQRCAPRRSIRHHPQAAASTEQRRKDRSTSAKTITRALAAEGPALVASGAARLLQAGLADVQDTANVSTSLSQSAHQGIMQRPIMQRHSVAAIIGRSASRRPLQTDRHRQTILQLRRTYSLELSASFCRQL